MRKNTPWLRFTATTMVISIVIHLFFGYLLGFSVDEAHYALYGMHLDWSYFDHPPLVGWIQAIPAKMHFNEGTIRLIPEFLWIVSILLSMKLAREITIQFSSSYEMPSLRSVDWWAALCIICAPILHVLGVGLLPDTLLMVIVPCMMLLTLSLHRELQQRYPKDLTRWVLLGVTLGLAGLSKYTSLFFALAIPFCLISWHGLKIFKRPGLYLALVIAALSIMPILYWNLHHSWISFVYQFNHGTGGDWKLKRVGVFVLNQMVCYGPLMLLGLSWIARRFLSIPKVMLSFFFIPFLMFAYFSGGGGSLPHWTSPAWIALSPIAAIGLANAWSLGRRFWIATVITMQLVICTLGFALLFFGGIPSISMNDPLGKNNPIADLYGWRDAGKEALALSEQYATPAIAVQNWTLGSRIAWYASPLPVYILDNRVDQFDLWFGNLPQGSNAIVLKWSQMSYEDPVGESTFESCEQVSTKNVHHFGRDISEFQFLVCKNWHGSVSSPESSKSKE